LRLTQLNRILGPRSGHSSIPPSAEGLVPERSISGPPSFVNWGRIYDALY